MIIANYIISPFLLWPKWSSWKSWKSTQTSSRLLSSKRPASFALL